MKENVVPCMFPRTSYYSLQKNFPKKPVSKRLQVAETTENTMSLTIDDKANVCNEKTIHMYKLKEQPEIKVHICTD